jgi:hypothetical protein
MIVKENVTIYKCQYCPKREAKIYIRMQDIVKHETNCYGNPKNWAACSGCKHLEEIKVEYKVDADMDVYIGTETKEANGFRCKKLEQKMYPFKAVRKGIVKRFPDTFKDQIQMPTRCNLREEEVLDWSEY